MTDGQLFVDEQVVLEEQVVIVSKDMNSISDEKLTDRRTNPRTKTGDFFTFPILSPYGSYKSTGEKLLKY